jgi:adenylate cyclase
LSADLAEFYRRIARRADHFLQRPAAPPHVLPGGKTLH